MGARGPVPKRSSQRRRVNKPEIPVDSADAAHEVAVPEPDPGWHPAAGRWYLSLGESGQSVFYEPSDWAQAWVWAEVLSRALNQGVRISSQLMMAWSSAATELLTTEGARRRVRIELNKAEKADERDVSGEAELYDLSARLTSAN